MLQFVVLPLLSFAFAAPASHTIQWIPCSSGLPPKLQCSELQVPLDWDHPKGKAITLGLTKIANNATDKKGDLFFNPGGPGVVTSDLLAAQALGYDIFGEALVNNFDIIGVDPRGIGLSQPVMCDPKAFNAPWPKFPQSEAAFNDLVRYNEAFWKSCLEQTGPLLGHIDTLSGAKDMEAVRKAMGTSELNYLGISYGTVLGSQYANLYPNNFRTMALDADVDHSQPLLDLWAAEVITYETELKRFFDWCDSNSTCPLHGRNITQIWTELIDSALENPIPAPGCDGPAAGCQTTAWGGDILFNAQDMLMFKEEVLWAKGVTWTTLATAIEQAAAGNATLLSSPTATSNSDGNFAEPAVQCADWSTPIETFSDLKHIYEIAEYLAPLTRGASQSYWTMVSCVGYPLSVPNPPATMNITNSVGNTVLMTNARYDPETSVVWAESLREQTAHARLVIRDGDGHTSFPLGEETTAIIDSYLVNKTLPGQDIVAQS